MVPQQDTGTQLHISEIYNLNCWHLQTIDLKAITALFAKAFPRLLL